MKSSMIYLLVLLSCSSKPPVIPPPAHPNVMKAPQLILPSDSDDNMIVAATAFSQYANSDEFYAYARKKISGLEGGNETSVEGAINRFRTCLNSMGPINVVWKKYSRKNADLVIGGWRKTYMAQNPLKSLGATERAGHWIHEICHACGLTHTENDIKKFPIIKRSWPYQIGYTFTDFLEEKAE